MSDHVELSQRQREQWATLGFATVGWQSATKWGESKNIKNLQHKRSIDMTGCPG